MPSNKSHRLKKEHRLPELAIQLTGHSYLEFNNLEERQINHGAISISAYRLGRYRHAARADSVHAGDEYIHMEECRLATIYMAVRLCNMKLHKGSRLLREKAAQCFLRQMGQLPGLAYLRHTWLILYIILKT